jgi:hypothetical protein
MPNKAEVSLGLLQKYNIPGMFISMHFTFAVMLYIALNLPLEFS